MKCELLVSVSLSIWKWPVWENKAYSVKGNPHGVWAPVSSCDSARLCLDESGNSLLSFDVWAHLSSEALSLWEPGPWDDHAHWKPTGVLWRTLHILSSRPYQPVGGKVWLTHISLGKVNNSFPKMSILISRICQCVTLDGKRLFVSVINLRTLRWEMNLEFSGSAQCNHQSPWKRK